MTSGVLAGAAVPLSKKPCSWRHRVISSACLLAMFLPACAPRTHYRELPEVPLAQEPLRAPLGLTLALDAVRLFGADGRELEPAPWLIRWIVERWRLSGLFEHVYGPADAEIAPPHSAHARLVLREAVDGGKSLNVIKSLLAVLTLFVLAPILPLNIDLKQAMECQIDLPDGGALRYEVSAAARQTVFAPRFDSAMAPYADVTAVNVAALAQHLRAEPRLRRWEKPAPGRRAAADEMGAQTTARAPRDGDRGPRSPASGAAMPR